MRRTLPCALVVWLLATTAVGISQVATRQADGGGLYDANPNHLWNRIHRHFFVRVRVGEEHGFDRVDPLLWTETLHLVAGPSHEKALALLDEFLMARGETLVADPLKRAVFQHDLWAVFDWVAGPYSIEPPRQALMTRLAQVMRRVALTSGEIARLPDTYGAAIVSTGLPALPRDFFGGSWVGVESRKPLVPQHASELSRSAFHVLWRVPGNETVAYLSRLWEFPQPFVPDPSFDLAGDRELRVKLNPALPAVPDGTQVALLRSMLLVGSTGRVIPTRIVETIQVRAFHSIQAFTEFTMSRAALFAGQDGGLRAVGRDERDFITFSSKGMDIFERNPTARGSGNPVLEMCSNCHSDFSARLESIRSLPQLLKPHPYLSSGTDPTARWLAQAGVSAEANTRRADWGALQALWR